MANLFTWTAVYVSIQDVKDSTNKAWIIALTDVEIQELIYKAQYRIDNYIWSYWTPYVDWQEFIFPVMKDDVSYIPTDIKQATIFVIEQIFENGDTIQVVNPWWQIISQKLWDRSISFDVWTISININWNALLWFSKEAEMILKKYKKVFYKIKI